MEKAVSTTNVSPPSSALKNIRVWHFAVGTVVAVLAIGGVFAAAQGTTSALYDEVVVGLALLVSILGWIAWTSLQQGIRLTALFGRPPVTVQGGGLVLVGGLTNRLMGRADVNVIVPLLRWNAPEWVVDVYTINMSVSSPESIPAILLSALLAIAFAGVFEEVVFRGLIFQRWAHAWNSTGGALLASAILFAGLHGFKLNTFVFAIVATLLYVKTRSLWAPIAMHMLINGSSLAGTEWVEKGGVMIGFAGRQEFGWACLTASVLLLGGLVWWCQDALGDPLPYTANVTGRQ